MMQVALLAVVHRSYQPTTNQASDQPIAKGCYLLVEMSTGASVMYMLIDDIDMLPHELLSFGE